MLQRILFFVFTFILLFTQITCEHNEHDETHELEKLTEQNPKEALRRIDSLYPEKQLNKETQKYMKIKLLKYKAEDRLYIKHQSDSLIQSLYDYFERKGLFSEMMEAKYYMGCTARDMLDYPSAIVCFNEVEADAANHNLSHHDSIVLYRVLNQHSSICRQIGLRQDAFILLRQSFDIQKNLGVADLWSYEDLGRIATCVDSIQLASKCFQEVMRQIVTEQSFDENVDFLGEQLGFYTDIGEEYMARLTLSFIQKVDKDKLPGNVHSAVAGYYLKIEHQLDSAIFHYKMSYEMKKQWDARMYAIETIAKCYASKGMKDQTLEYALRYFAIRDSADKYIDPYGSTIARDSMHIISMYNMRHSQRMMSAENKKVKIFLAAISTLLIFTCCFFVVRQRRLSHRLKKECMETKEKLLEIMAERDVLIGKIQSSTRNSDKNARLYSLKSVINEKISKPNEFLTEKEWVQVFEIVEILFPEFKATVYFHQGSLQKEDYLIACLLKLQYKQADIARVLGFSTSKTSRKVQFLNQQNVLADL